MKYTLIALTMVVLPLAGVPVLLLNSPGAIETSSGEDTTPESGSHRIAGIGYIEPASEIRRLVFRRDGVICEVHVDVGQSVEAEQVLARLHSEEEQGEVELARQTLARAQAEQELLLAGVNLHAIDEAEQQLALAEERLAYAKRDYTRYLSLRDRKAASEAQIDQAATTWRQADAAMQAARAHLEHLRHMVRDEDRLVADAKVQEAQARLRLAEEALEQTNLRAPEAGVVLEILKRAGDGTLTGQNDPILIFGDLNKLRVRAEVDERFVYALRPDLPVEVTARGLGGQSYLGRIHHVNSIMGPKTVFSRASDERVDLEVVQVLIDMGGDFDAPVGMRVDVYIDAQRLDEDDPKSRISPRG